MQYQSASDQLNCVHVTLNMANAKSKLLLVLLCVLVSVVVVQCLDTFANANRRSYNTFTMRHNDIGSDFRKITKRSHRTKREAVAAGDDICKKQDEHFLNGDKTDFSHNVRMILYYFIYQP